MSAVRVALRAAIAVDKTARVCNMTQPELSQPRTRHVEEQHQLGGLDHLLEHGVLVHGAREAVNQEGLGVGLLHGADHNIDHGLSGHQLALVHQRLALQAQLSAGGDLLAQQVAGGQVLVAILLDDASALGALAGAGAAQDEDDAGVGEGALRSARSEQRVGT